MVNPHAQKPAAAALLELAARVRLLVLDVDGVLTDGGLYLGPSGEALKRFCVRDGQGLALGARHGLPSALLSARSSPIVEARAAELGCVAVVQGRSDKGAALDELLARLAVPPADCAYMGDDLTDLPALDRVGLACCPADAALEVRQRAVFVAQSAGGHGAVRELVELCLKAREAWGGLLATFSTHPERSS